MQKLLTFFQHKYSVYAIFNDQSFNNTLTNDIVSFEQMGPRPFNFKPTNQADLSKYFGKYGILKD